MAKHRSVSFKVYKFLKAIKNQDLVKQFFVGYEIQFPDGINYDGDSFENFWNGVEKDKRTELEEILQCINDIADEARDCLQRAIREFSIHKPENEPSEATAMRVFLHSDKEAYSLAFDFYIYYCIVSERLSHHKFRNGTPDFSDARVGQFKSAVEEHFKECGKSDHCDIRPRIDDDKHIFLVARGDFPKTHLIFDETERKPDIESFIPLREDLMIYDTRTNILSVSIKGHDVEDDKKKYIEMFGKAFLGLEQIDETTLNDSLVDLDPIKKRSFNYGGNEQIESVKLVEVNANLRGGALRLTLKSNDLANTIQGFGLGNEETEYVLAKLKFFIKREGKKSKQVGIIIKPPENSKIPERKEKKIIEDYLKEQGVLLE